MARSDKRRLVRVGAVLAACVAPLLAACNAIIGLSDFEKVECSGGVCDGGIDVNVPDAPRDAPTDSPTLVDGGGTAPVRWANFIMPNYDAGPDSGIPNAPTMSPTAGGLKETKSGLSWELGSDGNLQISYADAAKYCANKAGGPWRVPSRIELVTLLDYTKPTRRFDSQFKGQSGVYWTSSEVRPFSPTAPQHWTVDFNTGLVGKLDRSASAYVRCIEGAK